MNNNNQHFDYQYADNSDTDKNQGITHKLALYALLGFIFLMPWADGIYDGLPKILGSSLFWF